MLLRLLPTRNEHKFDSFVALYKYEPDFEQSSHTWIGYSQAVNMLRIATLLCLLATIYLWVLNDFFHIFLKILPIFYCYNLGQKSQIHVLSTKTKFLSILFLRDHADSAQAAN